MTSTSSVFQTPPPPPPPEISQEELKARKDRYTQYCIDKGDPDFTPASGTCWECKNNIFKRYDGTSSITFCPFCNTSFVD
jgi:hypothetical protein